MQDIERQIQVINKIIHATDEEIHNLKFLLDRINDRWHGCRNWMTNQFIQKME